MLGSATLWPVGLKKGRGLWPRHSRGSVICSRAVGDSRAGPLAPPFTRVSDLFTGGRGAPALFRCTLSGAGWRRNDDVTTGGWTDVDAMRMRHNRRHLTHVEVSGGTCHITWRLHRHQPLLIGAERSLVVDVLRRASHFGCVWHAAVVMDDYVHALVTPGRDANSCRLANAWKGASSHRLVKEFGRQAPVWQAEYYQRWIGSATRTEACARDIRANPARRWPGIRTYPWLLP